MKDDYTSTDQTKGFPFEIKEQNRLSGDRTRLGEMADEKTVLSLPILNDIDVADLEILTTAVEAARLIAGEFRKIRDDLLERKSPVSRRIAVNEIVRDAAERALDTSQSWSIFAALAENRAINIRREIEARDQ